MYADVNVHRPREYWDYEALQVTWGDQVRENARPRARARASSHAIVFPTRVRARPRARVRGEWNPPSGRRGAHFPKHANQTPPL